MQISGCVSAAGRGDVDTVKRILKDAPDIINSMNHEGRTSLMAAAEKGQSDVVQLLLDQGVDDGRDVLSFADEPDRRKWEVCQLLCLEVRLRIAESARDLSTAIAAVSAIDNIRKEFPHINRCIPTDVLLLIEDSSSDIIALRTYACNAVEAIIQECEIKIGECLQRRDASAGQHWTSLRQAALLLHNDVKPKSKRVSRVVTTDELNAQGGPHVLLCGDIHRDSAESSGASLICDAVYTVRDVHDNIVRSNVKVKIAKCSDDIAVCDALKQEYQYLLHLHEHCPGLFIRPLMWLSDVSVSSEVGDDCSSLVGFVMQAGGANLQVFLKTNKLPQYTDKLRHAVDLVHIVQAAHNNQIALCDLKPTNVVFIAPEHSVGRFVGIDLDGACALNTTRPLSKIVSTPAYRHPMLEKARRKGETDVTVTHALDLWSLGMCWLQIFTGEDFFTSRGAVTEYAVLDTLESLEQNDIDDFIDQRFSGGQMRPVGIFLKQLLQVNHVNCPSLSSLLRKQEAQFIYGCGSSVTTSRVVRTIDAFTFRQEQLNQKLDHVISEMDEMKLEVLDAVADTRSVLVLHCQGFEDKIETIGSALEKQIVRVNEVLTAACHGDATIDDYEDLYDAIKCAKRRLSNAVKNVDISDVIREAVERAVKACSSMKEDDVKRDDATLEQLRAMASGLSALQQDMMSIRELVAEQSANIQSLHVKFDTMYEMLQGFSSETVTSIHELMLRSAASGRDDEMQELMRLVRDLNVVTLEAKTDLPLVMSHLEQSLRSMLSSHFDTISESSYEQHDIVMQRISSISASLSARDQYSQQQLTMLQEKITDELQVILSSVMNLESSMTIIGERVGEVLDAVADTRSVLVLHCQGFEDKIETIGSALEKQIVRVNEVLTAACHGDATIDDYEDLYDAIKCAKRRLSNAVKNVDISDVIREAVERAVKASSSMKENEVKRDDATLEQLRVMASGLSALQQDMMLVRRDVLGLNETVQLTLQSTLSLSRMLGSVLRADTRVPLLLVVMPVKPSGVTEKFMSLVTKTVSIHFVCPVTRQPVASGKDGKGYRLTLPRDWVVRVAPLLQLCAVMMKVTLLAMGIPFLSVPGLGSAQITVPYIEDMLAELKKNQSDIAQDACEKLLEAAKDACGNVTNEYETNLQAAASRVLEMEETRHAFEEVYQLLRDKLEKPKNPSPDWKPKHTGLIFVDGSMTCDGSSGWVSPEAVSTFRRLGQRAFLQQS